VTRLLSRTSAATELVDVAMGRKPADTVIRNGRWVNVHSGEIIAIAGLMSTALFLNES